MKNKLNLQLSFILVSFGFSFQSFGKVERILNSIEAYKPIVIEGKSQVSQSTTAPEVKKEVEISISEPAINSTAVVDDGNDDTDSDYFDEESGTEGSVCPTCDGQGQSQTDIKPEKSAINITIDQEFSFYSDTSQMEQTIRIAQANIISNQKQYIVRKKVYSRKLRKSVMKVVRTNCYGAVKDALRESGILRSNFIGSGVAKGGVKDLESQGFKNLLKDPKYKDIMKNPDMAPKGAIIVYANIQKPRKAGHIEIKTGSSGENGYISFKEGIKPAFGLFPNKRRLIGVMVKI